MEQVIWSKLALNDIDIIHNYIAQESPYYARKTIEGFLICKQLQPIDVSLILIRLFYTFKTTYNGRYPAHR
jgi:hypothetical protein